MPILAIFWPILVFLLREVVVKFLLMGALYALMALFIPWIMSLLAPLIGIGSLNSLFSGIPPGIWFFWDLAQLGVGIPLIISAYVARFLIRRIPFFG